jgi:DNA-binding MarR family transcriptional regulator
MSKSIQQRVLEHVTKRQPIQVSEVAVDLGLGHEQVSAALARMEAKGLVARGDGGWCLSVEPEPEPESAPLTPPEMARALILKSLEGALPHGRGWLIAAVREKEPDIQSVVIDSALDQLYREGKLRYSNDGLYTLWSESASVPAKPEAFEPPVLRQIAKAVGLPETASIPAIVESVEGIVAAFISCGAAVGSSAGNTTTFPRNVTLGVARLAKECADQRETLRRIAAAVGDDRLGEPEQDYVLVAAVEKLAAAQRSKTFEPAIVSDEVERLVRVLAIIARHDGEYGGEAVCDTLDEEGHHCLCDDTEKALMRLVTLDLIKRDGPNWRLVRPEGEAPPLPKLAWSMTVPNAISLWLRLEPEGHYTLLVEGPGTPRRALGIVEADAADVPANVVSIGEVLSGHAVKVALALVDAFEEGHEQPSLNAPESTAVGAPLGQKICLELKKGPRSLKTLQAALDTHPVNVSMVLDSLVRLGVVARRPEGDFALAVEED